VLDKDLVKGLVKDVPVSHRNKFKCLLLNARSIVGMQKRCELESQLRIRHIDIAAVTESWANENVSDSELSIDGYCLYRKDRCSCRDARCGGILIYVHENITSYSYDKLNDYKCESLWIRLCTSSKMMLDFDVCYRSQTASNEEIEHMLAYMRVR